MLEISCTMAFFEKFEQTLAQPLFYLQAGHAVKLWHVPCCFPLKPVVQL